MKKSYIILGVILAVAYAALFFVTKSQVSKLERQIAQLTMMGAGGTGASFYPVSGALTGGGTGALDKITSVSDKDGAIVLFNDIPGWGNAFMPFTLDQSGGCGSEVAPTCIEAGDAGEWWELVDGYFSGVTIYGQASGGARTYSVASGVTNASQLSDVTGISTLVAAEVNGTLINVDSSGVTRFTLPTPASGYNTIFTMGISGVTVQVESGTTMYVNGTATVTGGVGAQIVSVTPGEYITCWTANIPVTGAGGGGGEIEWFCRKQED